ncbi:TRAPP-interacting plant protein [Hibiscus trionum]|uniref:TRAPP-interacting plant protein n=1 Tax=Hibiscus trionum TaxID=183268 RepID=A0A9W7IRD5_HIBTR|nr:TRAPP-interacting plant protein [Hibiscus trionum]
MNFLLPRSNQQGTHEPIPVQEDMSESSHVPESVTSLEKLIAEDPFPEYPKAESHGQGNGFLGKNADVATDKNASVIPSHTDVTEEDGWIIIPHKALPDDWNHAPDVRSLRSLDRSFVFPGEQVHVLACLSASNQETVIITPFKVAAAMSKNGMRKGAERQKGNMEGEKKSVAGGDEVSQGGAVMDQNDENLEKEKIDPAKHAYDSESFLRMEDQRRQTETLLKRFSNSHFFVRIAEWSEPLWSKKSASQTTSDSSEMDSQWSIGNETKNTAKSVSSPTAVIDRGNFDADVSGGVARGTVKCCPLSNGDIVVLLQVNVGIGFLEDPVIEILQFEKFQDRNLSENQNSLVYANHDPCGELLKWLLPVDNILPPPSALSSPHLGPAPGIGTPSHKTTPSASSGSQLFSFSNLRSYSMSSLPQSVPSPRGPIKAPSSRPSFDLDEVDHYSSQKTLKSQRTVIEDLLSFRGVSLELERFSVRCGLQGIHIPGRRWRKKLEIIQPIEIRSYAANCNTDDLLCIQIKNVSPAHIPDIVVYVDAITIVLEEASKVGPPASLPIACIEAGDDHSLPNLALRRGEEHSFILKPASSMWKNLITYGEKSKSSGLKPLLKTFNRKGSTLTGNQYAIMVSCRCNYSESRLFFKKPINWRPRISRDLMISVACEMSGQYSGSSETSTQLPVQVLTLQASNLTPEDLTMTVLAPASFTSPPSVVSLNSYPATPRSPFHGFPSFAMISSSERHGSSMQRLGSMPTISENQKQNGDARTRFTSFDEQLTPVADFIPTSGLGCTHIWLQSRVPLGRVPAQSTATIKMELLPLTDGIITLDSLRIDVKEKGCTYIPERSLMINATSSISTGII